jgi:hypothetical protein
MPRPPVLERPPTARPLTAQQLHVLEWIADGCPPRAWPDEHHKQVARALASRHLAKVGRRGNGSVKVWVAEITGEGRAYLNGRAEAGPKPLSRLDADRAIARAAARRLGIDL